MSKKTTIYILAAAFCCFFFFSGAANANTYYVDSSRPDDSGSGLTHETAWKSTEKVNETTFQPGDSILFKRGGVWHGQIKPKASGTEEKPITYGAYGTGDNPLIINGKFFPKGTTWSGPDQYGVYSLSIGSNTEFSGSSIVGVLRGQPTGHATYKRVFQNSVSPDLLQEDEVISSDLVSGQRIVRYKPLAGHTPGEYDWEFSKWQGTVHFSEVTSWVVVDGFAFYNSYYGRLDQTSRVDQGIVNLFGSHCTVKNSILSFGNIFGAEFQGPASQYNTLENCDIQHNRASGVDLREGASHNAVKGCIIANNSLGNTASEVQFDRGGIVTLGDLTHGSVSHITIEGNTIHDNADQNPTRNNAAILLDGTQYWTIRNNYIYNSPRRAIATSDNDGTELAKNHHIDIQYNIIRDWDTNREGYRQNVAIQVSAKGDDEGSGYIKIENNTFYARDNIELIGLNILLAYPEVDFMKDIRVRNNIVYLANNTQPGSVGIRFNRSKNNFPGAIVDNNLVFGASNLYEYDANPFSSLSQFQQFSGWATNDIGTDPLFANASGNFSKPSDFELSDNSPAINAGVDVGYTKDYAGNTVPAGSAPDIGAYEHRSTFESDITSPSAIVDLSTSNITQDSVILSWVAPGDDGPAGTATIYDIRYSTFVLSESTWASASQAFGEPAPQSAGTNQSFTITGLSSNTNYYFTIKTTDEAGNVSVLSNVASAKTLLPPDTAPPSVSITAPTNGSTVSGIVSIQATATDDRGVLGIQFKVDGISVGPEDTAAPYSISWDTNKFINGLHTIEAIARDAAGNISTSSPVTVTVNNLNPQPTPTLGATLQASPTSGNTPLSVNFTASASGTATGPVVYTFYCKRSDAGTNITYPYSVQQTDNPTHPCKYTKAGTYTAKVIVQRQGLSAEARVNITVSKATGKSKGAVAGVSQYHTNLTENTLYKSSNSPNVYLIRNGQKILIPSMDVLQRSGFNSGNIQTASATDLNDTTTAHLVKSDASDKVYLIKQYRKLWIPTAEDFEVSNYQWADIVSLPDPIDSSIPLAMLVKTDFPNAIYALENSQIRHIVNPEVFNSYGWDWSEPVMLTVAELDMYSQANLVKAQNDDKVYLLENNQKRHIATASIFDTHGFVWANIQTITQTELNAYETAGEVR